MESFAKFGEYGLVGLFLGAVIFILYRMIVWVMAFVKEQSTLHASEREKWMQIVSALKASVELHNQQSMSTRESMCEAHRFQREEHKEMIGNLKEITHSLGRINGYKHE